MSYVHAKLSEIVRSNLTIVQKQDRNERYNGRIKKIRIFHVFAQTKQFLEAKQ